MSVQNKLPYEGLRDMTGHNELIERLKVATGPDRELDEAIALALCDEHFFAQLADAPEGTGCEMYRMGHHSFSSALRVTSSVDAALGLVERMLPGWKWNIGYDANDELQATVWHGVTEHDEYAPTAPRALLAALLSALGAINDQ